MTISPTMLRIEARRRLRNPYTLAFTLVMPLVMYVVFGATPSYADQSVGHGNVAYIVLVSMAAYGAAVVMSTLTASAATEVQAGWGRQLALTPLGTAGYVVTKLVVAVSFAALVVAVLFVVGLATGARADDAWRWLASAGIILVLGLMFGLYGLAVGLVFSADTASAIVSISMIAFAFLGNAFMPLDGLVLDIAHGTPLYGFVALARWPVSGGALTTGQTDAVWAVVLDVIVWFAVFAVLVFVAARHARGRR